MIVHWLFYPNCLFANNIPTTSSKAHVLWVDVHAKHVPISYFSWCCKVQIQRLCHLNVKVVFLAPKKNVNFSFQLISNPCFFCSWLNLTNFPFVFSLRHTYFFVIGIFYSFSSWQTFVCYNVIRDLFLHLYSLRPFSYLNTYVG
jgi:hypothetical protein